ncbi:hypothetical protein EBU91_02675 [bacterium]|nr:hypothetical protein [bacterium]
MKNRYVFIRTHISGVSNSYQIICGGKTLKEANKLLHNILGNRDKMYKPVICNADGEKMEHIKKKKSSKKIKIQEQVEQKTHGNVQGEYTTFEWNNGELINFYIDWDKLSNIVKTLK